MVKCNYDRSIPRSLGMLFCFVGRSPSKDVELMTWSISRFYEENGTNESLNFFRILVEFKFLL